MVWWRQSCLFIDFGVWPLKFICDKKDDKIKWLEVGEQYIYTFRLQVDFGLLNNHEQGKNFAKK